MNFQGMWLQANEQMIKFWQQSGSRTRIMTLARRALAEVCTVPVLLVNPGLVLGAGHLTLGLVKSAFFAQIFNFWELNYTVLNLCMNQRITLD